MEQPGIPGAQVPTCGPPQVESLPEGDAPSPGTRCYGIGVKTTRLQQNAALEATLGFSDFADDPICGIVHME